MERDGLTAEAGMALISTVAVLSIVLAVSASAVTVTLSDIVGARKANALTAAHAMAEAGADQLFARALRDPASFTTARDPGRAPDWATLVNGAPVACGDPYSTVCYQVDVAVATQPGNPYARAVTVVVTAATLCPRGLGELVTCVTDTVRQRLVQRQFFDYLYLDELETLDPFLLSPAARDQAARQCQAPAIRRPAACSPVPFIGPTSAGGGDTVYGPIHTNDASFSSCLGPDFEPPLSRVGWPSHKTVVADPTALESTGSAVFLSAPGAACAASSPHEAQGVSEAPGSPHYSFAVDVSQLARIVAPADRYPATTTITLHGGASPGRGTYTSGDQTRPWPGTGLIYIDGDVYVSGDACDPVSIAATGTIYIDGDLTYGPDERCPRAATGLESDDAVVVLTSDGPSGPSVNGIRDRSVQAAVLALGKHSCFSTAAGGASPPPGVTCALAPGDVPRGGSFSVQGWDTSPVETPHTLHFLGAVAAIWRGAIGAFDPATGRLESGWAKDFAFDRTLRTTQPPYFLAPVGAGWARTDLAAVNAS